MKMQLLSTRNLGLKLRIQFKITIQTSLHQTAMFLRSSLLMPIRRNEFGAAIFCRNQPVSVNCLAVQMHYTNWLKPEKGFSLFFFSIYKDVWRSSFGCRSMDVLAKHVAYHFIFFIFFFIIMDLWTIEPWFRDVLAALVIRNLVWWGMFMFIFHIEVDSQKIW